MPIPNSDCGIPSDAAAYSLNATVVPRGSLGYLTIWPTGQPRPVVSTLNSLDGRIKANAAIVPAGVAGSISVFVTDATELILDINGYFVSPHSATMGFVATTPCPAGENMALASTLNAIDGALTSNAAILRAGNPGGAIRVFGLSTTHFLLEINGYFK